MNAISQELSRSGFLVSRNSSRTPFKSHTPFNMPAEQRLSGSEVRRRVPKNSVWDSANYPLALVGLVSRETGRVRDLKQLAGGDGGSGERSRREVLHAATLSSLSSPRIAHLPRPFTSCCATRTFPSWTYFSRRAKHFPCGTPHFQSKERGGHASASNFPELCDSDGLRRHPSKCRVFARVSGNVGTTNGLHARRLAAVRRASPRCGQDRGLLTAKYAAAQRSVPRGF